MLTRHLGHFGGRGLRWSAAGSIPSLSPLRWLFWLAVRHPVAREPKKVGKLFGPVMLVYFFSAGADGVANIRAHPCRAGSR